MVPDFAGGAVPLSLRPKGITHMPRIIGQLLKIEQVPAYTDRATGEVKREAFPRLHVLEGHKVYEVNVARDYAAAGKPIPQENTPVDLSVEVRTYVSRGNAQMVFDLLDVLAPAQHADRKAA